MRPVTLNLGVLIRDPVNDNAWPGVDEVIEFNDTTCPAVDDEETSWLVEQVFVVMGYDSNQGDSVPAPSGWQVFSMEEARELIPGWAAESLEFHAATKITCSNDPDNFYVVGDSYFDVVNAFNTCCGAPNVPSQALALKASSNPLEPGVTYPCDTPAQFTFIAIKGNNDVRDLLFTMIFTIRDSANANPLTFEVAVDQPLSATTQVNLAWFLGFIGLISDGGVELVANSDPQDGTHVRVLNYDGGTIEMTTTITDNADSSTVSTQTNTWALPGTQCGAGCVSVYPESTEELPDGTMGVPYNASFQLGGQAPWLFQVIDKPSWMTATLDPLTGIVSVTGTPDAFGEDIALTYSAANCGNELAGEQTQTFDVVQEFLVQSQPNPSARNYSESIYVPFLGLWMAWSSSDDGSGERVITSPDGETWTPQNTGAFTGSIQEAAAGPDRVIFVGPGAAALMTVDGVNFTTFNMPQAIQHTGIAYDPVNALFVIVAQQGSNRVFTTVDGSSVNTITAPVLNNWRSLTWSDTLQLLIAVATSGSGNQVMTSDDGGTTWTPQTTPTPTRQWIKVKELNGRIFAIAQDGTERLMYSDDAVTWTLLNIGSQVGSSAFWGTDLAYGNGLYLIVASASAGAIPQFIKSTDPGGLVWSSGGLSPTAQWSGVSFKQSLNRFSITGLGPGSGMRAAIVDWLP